MPPIKGQIEHRFENELYSLLPYDELYALARSTGFCERLRKLHPVIFILTLLTHRGFHSTPTIRELWHRYIEMSGYDGPDPSKVIRYQSYFNRFDWKLVLYLKTLCVFAMERLDERSPLKLHGKLERFRSVLIQDNTIVRLHEKLSKLFPATRTTKPGCCAGIKASVVLNVTTHSPDSLSVVPERTHDMKTLKIGGWVKDRLIIFDLGFYKHWTFQKIHENGGYFLARLKSNVKPKVVRILDSKGREFAPELAGRHVHEVLDLLPHKPVIMEVQVAFRRRKYRKKTGSIDIATFYCFSKYNHEASKWHTYITNLSPETFSVEDICALYAYRWTIEMFFKEMKSDSELGCKKSVNKDLSIAWIYIALLRTLVSRSFYLLVISHLSLEHREKIPTLLWSRIFCEHLPRIAMILRKELKYGMTLGDEWKELIRVLKGNAIPVKRAKSRLIDPTGP